MEMRLHVLGLPQVMLLPASLTVPPCGPRRLRLCRDRCRALCRCREHSHSSCSFRCPYRSLVLLILGQSQPAPPACFYAIRNNMVWGFAGNEAVMRMRQLLLLLLLRAQYVEQQKRNNFSMWQLRTGIALLCCLVCPFRLLSLSDQNY